MIHIRQEGKTLKNGFNFYPLSDKNSFGFVLRYGKNLGIVNLGSKVFWFRYSKKNKIWIIGNEQKAIRF